jgi:hypothetical protein
MSIFKEKAKEFASKGFNKLPDSANLFLRYMTGVGGENLDLDDKTIEALRESTKQPSLEERQSFFENRGPLRPDFMVAPDFASIPTSRGRFSTLTDARTDFSRRGMFMTPPPPRFRRIMNPNSLLGTSDYPKSGAVNPYMGGFEGADKVQTTLGRFMSKVNPSLDTVNISDTYDMINEMEDPDLVSGKIQPVKAFKELFGRGNIRGDVYGGGPKGFATRAARSLMYGLPIKPKPYPVNIDIPFSGDINNKEIYN